MKKAPPPPGKKAPPPPPAIPTHELMLDNKEWDRVKVLKFICEKTALSSMSLASILKLGVDTFDTFPGYSTVRAWIAEDAKVSDLYARAKEDQADYMSEEILDIADDSRNDYITKMSKNGNEYEAVDNEAIQRSRLRVEARKWLAAKLKPKRYGDKLSLDATVSANPLDAVSKQLESDPELAGELADGLEDT